MTDEIFGEVIDRYTRAQAITDGLLVDLTEPRFTFREELNICQEAGIVYPVAMTAAAFAETIGDDTTGECLVDGQDISGRLWDVLFLFRLAARRTNSDRFRFDVLVWDGEKQNPVPLKALCGPGDDGEPVITILLLGEDCGTATGRVKVGRGSAAKGARKRLLFPMRL